MWENFKEKFQEVTFLSSDVADGEELRNRILKISKGNQLTYWGCALAVLLVAMGLNSNNIILLIGGMMLMPLFGSMISLAYAFVEGEAILVGSSLLHFVVQTVIGVMASAFYFLVVGASKDASQLLYSTSPSFSMAFIGLIAGIITAIAITREEKVGVFSGVAVATAMLPSICTMGCGVAKGAFVYISGGLYMLFINSYFVCIGAVIVFFLINRGTVIVRRRKNVISRIYLIIFAFIAVAPVGLLIYQTYIHGITDYNIQRYVEEQYDFGGTRVVGTNVDKEENVIEVLLLGKRVSEKNINKAKEARKIYLLDDMEIKVFQSREDPDSLLPDNLKKDKIRQYGETLKVMYPEILTCSIGYVTNYEDNSKSIMVYLTTSEGLSQNTITEIKGYLAAKTEIQPVKLLYDIQDNSSINSTESSSSTYSSTSAESSSSNTSGSLGY